MGELEEIDIDELEYLETLKLKEGKPKKNKKPRNKKSLKEIVKGITRGSNILLATINTIFFLIFIGSLLQFAVFNKEDNKEYTREMHMEAEGNIKEDLFSYRPQDISANEVLAFKTANKTVEVYVAEELIYTLYPTSLNHSKSTGLYWNIVPIERDYAGKIITVKTKTIYSNSDNVIEYYNGDLAKLMKKLVKEDIYEVICSFGMYVAILLMIINMLVNKVNIKGKRHMLSVIAVAVLIVTWRASETDIYLVLMPNGIIWLSISLLAIVAMPLALSFYLKNLLTDRVKGYVQYLILFNRMIITYLLANQIFKIKELREIFSMAHIAIGITVIVALVLVIVEWKYEKRLSLAAKHLIYAFTIAGFNVYMYTVRNDNMAYASTALLIYIAVVVVEEGKKAKQYEKEVIERKTYQELAYTDIMTGIYNKSGTEKKIFEELNKKNQKALFMIDLDNFKQMNDTMGHAVGDSVLIEVSNRLSSIFRNRDVVGRVGGDEFIALITECEDSSVVEARAKEILRTIKVVRTKGDVKVTVTCSVGVAIYPMHGKNFEELYRAADKAMYKIKNNKKDGYQIYSTRMQ